MVRAKSKSNEFQLCENRIISTTKKITFITEVYLYNFIQVSFSLKCFIYELSCNNYNSFTGVSCQTVTNYILGTSLNESKSDMYTLYCLWKGNPFPWRIRLSCDCVFHIWLVHLSMQNKYVIVCTHTAKLTLEMPKDFTRPGLIHFEWCDLISDSMVCRSEKSIISLGLVDCFLGYLHSGFLQCYMRALAMSALPISYRLGGLCVIVKMCNSQ